MNEREISALMMAILFKGMNKEEILFDLIELSKNSIPITLGSLINTFDEVQYLSKCYRDFIETKDELYSGFFIARLGDIDVKIRFIPQTAVHTDTECKEEDNVIVIYIYNNRDSEMDFVNDEYMSISPKKIKNN